MTFDEYLDDPFEDPFERDDFDYWGNAVEQLSAEALHFSAPLQDTMRLSVMKMRQTYGDRAIRMPVERSFYGYRQEFEAAGVSPPKTVGDLQSYLTRSMYPSFIEMARQKSHQGQGFFEAFSDITAGYLEGLGHYAPTTSTEYLRGTRTAFYGANQLARAFQQTGAPSGTLSMGVGGEAVPGRTYSVAGQYMGGDDFIYNTPMHRWETETMLQDYERTRPVAMTIPQRTSGGMWRQNPWQYGQPKWRHGYEYLQEGSVNPAPWEHTGAASQAFKESVNFNWRYQQRAGMLMGRGRQVGGWITSSIRGGAFDPQYDAAQQAVYRVGGQGWQGVEDIYPMPTFGHPHAPGGRETWGSETYHFGLSMGAKQEEAYRKHVLRGRIANRTYFLPSYAGEGAGYVEGEYTVSHRRQMPQLGPGAQYLLPPGEPLGENQFYSGPTQRVRPYPMPMGGQVVGAPYAPGSTVYGMHQESIYSESARAWHDPYDPEEALLRAKLDAARQYRGETMPRPDLSPGDRRRSEGIVPGENQYYYDYGARHHPSAAEISEGQWRNASAATPPLLPPGPIAGEPPPAPETAPPGVDPFQVGKRYYQTPEIQRMLNALGAGRNVMGSLRPGFGKTEAIAGASELSPVSIATSPLTALNQQHVDDLRKRGIQAFNLIGHPGAGVDDTEWGRVHSEFRQAIYDAVDPETGQLKEGAQPVVGVMSFEKLAAMDPRKGMGKVLSNLSQAGVLRTVSVDEAQEIGRGGRLMVKRLAENIRNVMPEAAVSLLGGTITRAQESMLAGLFDIDEQKDIVRAPVSMKHLDVSMEAVRQADYEATGGRYAREARGGQVIYGYSTKLVDQIANRAGEEGRTSYRYHKGLGLSKTLIPQEELSQVEAVLGRESGLTKEETVAGSSAIGLGLNIKGVESVGQVGAARPSDIVQRALRVRPGRLESGAQDLNTVVGEFRFASDPKQYEQFAMRATQNTEALTARRLATAYRDLVAGGAWDMNWRQASQEIDKRLGTSLAAQMPDRRGMEYSGGEASRILQEAGLLRLGEVEVEGGETVQNWIATQPPSTGDVEERILNARYRSEFDPRRTNMRFREFRTEASEFAAREYRAMGSMVRQTAGLDPKKAGQFLTRGLSAWMGAGGGDDPKNRYASLNALEDFAEVSLPKGLSDDYVNAVKGAIDALEQQSSNAGDMNAAMKQFNAEVTQAWAGISGSPAAQQRAVESLAEMGYDFGGGGSPRGRAALGAAALTAQMNAQYGGGGPGGPGGGPPGRGPMGYGGGNMLRRAGAFGQMLYGAYIGSRFWRMFAEPSMQAMSEYGAMEEALQPLYMGDEYELTGAARMRGEYEQTRMNLGRGAYQSLSPIMGGMYELTKNQQASRVLATGGIGLGVMAGGVIGSQMLASMSMFTASLGGAAGAAGAAAGTMAGVMPVAGALIGGAVLGYGGYREWQIAREEESAFAEAYPQYAIQPDRGMYATEAERRSKFMRAGDPYPTMPDGRMPQTQRAGTGPTIREQLKQDYLRSQDVTAIAQQIAEESGFAGEMAEEIVPLMYQVGMASGVAPRPGIGAEPASATYGSIGEIAQIASRLGVGAEEYYMSGSAYAESMGAKPGTMQYHDLLMEFANQKPTQQYDTTRRVSQVEQYASQLAPYVGTDRARALTRRYNLTDQVSAGRAQSMLREYRTRYGDPMAPMQRVRGRGRVAYNVRDTASADALVGMAMDMTPMQQAFVQQAAGMFADAGQISTGGQYAEFMGTFAASTASFTPNQMDTAMQAMSGDYRAMSFLAWNDPSVLDAVGLPSGAAAKMFNQFGQPIYQTSGRDFLAWGQSLLGTDLQSAQTGGMFGTGFQMLQGQPINLETTGAWLNQGLDYQMSPEMVQAFHEGGVRGAQLLTSQRRYQTGMAGIGIQMAQIAAQERFLWGGGAWTGTPAKGSMWYLQDQMRALQYESQMSEFAYTTERMETQNQFAIRGEDIQLRRMDASQGMQLWQRGFNQQGMALAREWGREDFGFRAQGMALQQRWAREDWAYQDQRRALEWEWGMEDIDEAIRMSSGRERKQLIKQRERMGITKGMDDEQLEKVRERQETMWKREEEAFDRQMERKETMWAREEEQFDKTAEYQDTIMGLDREQFDLNKESRETLYEMDKENLERRIEDFEKQKELQDEIIELQRNHQVEQLALSKAALGVQAQSLQNQREMEDTIMRAQPYWDDVEDEMNQISSYGNVKSIFYSFKSMSESVNSVSILKINRLKSFIEAFR